MATTTSKSTDTGSSAAGSTTDGTNLSGNPVFGGVVQGTNTGATTTTSAPAPASSTDTLTQLLGNLTGANRDAAAAAITAFDSYGLSSLGAKIVQFVQQGYDANTINLLLQQTPEYKARFAGNQARLAAGLPVLAPADYLSVESSYRQIMSSAGLPAGFYDNPTDFADLIGRDVSPTELQGRVQVASNLLNQADPGTLAKYNQWYSNGDIIASVLDSKKAEPLIEQQYQAAQIASRDQGLGISQTQAEQLAGQGITQSQATAGFGEVNRDLAPTQELASIYGKTWTTEDAINEVFNQDANATLERQGLVREEKATFGGTTGTGATSLGRQDAGQY